MKNKRDRLFFTQLFVPQASQSSYYRRTELEVLLAIPSAQSACGMEIRMEENEGKEKKQKKKTGKSKENRKKRRQRRLTMRD